jgi:spore germination protein KB
VIQVLIYYAVIMVLLANEINLDNLLPVFDVTWLELLKGSDLVLTTSYGWAVVFLQVVPYYNQQKSLGKVFVPAFLISGGIFLVSMFRSISVLGRAGAIDMFAFADAVRLIHVSLFLTRMEILSAMFMSFAGFMRSAIFLYFIVLALAQLLKMRAYKPLVFPLVILAVCMCRVLYHYYPMSTFYEKNIQLWYNHIFCFGLPLLTLIVAKLRRRWQVGSEDHP